MKLNKNILSHAEIDSLISGIDAFEDDELSLKSNPSPYSVTNQEPIDKFNFPYLYIVNQRFANYLILACRCFLETRQKWLAAQLKEKNTANSLIDLMNMPALTYSH